MAKAVNVIAPTRKRLLNLHKRGQEVVFEDAEGPFSIWVQRIDPWEENQAIMQSKVPKAPIMALKRNPLDPGRLAYHDLMERWGLNDRDTQITFLISPKVQQAQASAEARIAAEDEWAKEDYLISLQESFNDTLQAVLVDNPEDEDAMRVINELTRYTEQVEAAVAYDEGELRAEMQNEDDAVIEEKVLQQLIEAEANAVQMNEFRKWRLFYSLRNPDNHDELLLESRDDLEHMDEKDIDKLMEAYLDVSFDGIEGKD